MTNQPHKLTAPRVRVNPEGMAEFQRSMAVSLAAIERSCREAGPTFKKALDGMTGSVRK